SAPGARRGERAALLDQELRADRRAVSTSGGCRKRLSPLPLPCLAALLPAAAPAAFNGASKGPPECGGEHVSRPPSRRSAASPAPPRGPPSPWPCCRRRWPTPACPAPPPPTACTPAAPPPPSPSPSAATACCT